MERINRVEDGGTFVSSFHANRVSLPRVVSHLVTVAAPSLTRPLSTNQSPLCSSLSARQDHQHIEGRDGERGQQRQPPVPGGGSARGQRHLEASLAQR